MTKSQPRAVQTPNLPAPGPWTSSLQNCERGISVVPATLSGAFCHSSLNGLRHQEMPEWTGEAEPASREQGVAFGKTGFILWACFSIIHERARHGSVHPPVHPPSLQNARTPRDKLGAELITAYGGEAQHLTPGHLTGHQGPKVTSAAFKPLLLWKVGRAFHDETPKVM